MPKTTTAIKSHASAATQPDEANTTTALGAIDGPKVKVPSELEGQVERHACPRPAAIDLTIIGQGVKATSASKQNLVIARLKTPRGATLAKLMEITGWQQHTVRGFLSAVVRKKLDLPLTSETGKDGNRRYRIAKAGEGNCA
jgi:hypothetical protein